MRELSELAFFRRFGNRRDNQLDHRHAVLGDDDFLALRGVFDELRKVGLGFVEIDLPRHGATLGQLVKLVKLDQTHFIVGMTKLAFSRTPPLGQR